MDSRYFLAGFALYLLIMIGISYLVSRRQQSSEDFLLAGRKVSGGLTFGTTVATMIGTGTSMGAVGFAYTHGWSGMLYGIGGAVGILLTAWWFAPLRQMRFMTMSEELSYYVGANTWVKNGSAVLIFLASLGWLGAHIIGGALYLSWATGIEMFYAKLLIALAFTFYVMIGGYKAVVWTDSLMAIVLFSGFLLMSYFALEAFGGLNQVWQSVITAQQKDQMKQMELLPAISLAAVVAVGVLATPSFRQRIYSGRSVQSVRRSFVFAGVLYLLFAALPALIGISARILAPDLTNHQFAFTTVAVMTLPAVFAMLVLLAGLSATLSSASSDSIAAVSVLIRDLYQTVTGRMPKAESAILYSRIAVMMVSVLALLLALMSNDLIRYITGMIATLMSGIFVIAVLGRFWLRLSWQGALAALSGAVVTSIVMLNHPYWLAFWGNPCLPALAVSLSLACIVSLLSKPSAVSRQQGLDRITRQREGLPELSGSAPMEQSSSSSFSRYS
ncbi:MAG: sodium:solute symporter family protein [Gammaproteobacteria bacterium]|nr:sodium:solute symporter family protein [Gammaproteobacteria bacterium]MBU2060002.1 sodium:solute symporter family protein [Gammaproteobacteria bacterium]MBU2174161.1 sodium:solute symporter family protein [Gammaproteobacteria bacterium]MBU2248368.1 sodium:solute symporter family protein [Gammaproteobacteria bacterium]MBU2346230.1 sodium:solute symporter family protein [Gammaproteobacteria bacterium]